VAQQRMAEHHIEALPVMEKGRFQGLLTLRDIDEVFRLLSVSPQLLQSRKSIVEELVA